MAAYELYKAGQPWTGAYDSKNLQSGLIHVVKEVADA